jgi:penicillin-binding protein 1C
MKRLPSLHASRRGALAAVCLVALLAVALWLRLGPIDPSLVDVSDLTSTVVVDRRGVPLYESLSGDGTRNVHLDARQLPPVLVAATLAAEDRRFWSHPGVDPIAIARALRQNLSEGSVVEGGSTITQQVASCCSTADLERDEGVREGRARPCWPCGSSTGSTNARSGLYLNLAAYSNRIVGAGRQPRLLGASRRCSRRRRRRFSWPSAAAVGLQPVSASRPRPSRASARCSGVEAEGRCRRSRA